MSRLNDANVALAISETLVSGYEFVEITGDAMLWKA